MPKAIGISVGGRDSSVSSEIRHGLGRYVDRIPVGVRFSVCVQYRLRGHPPTPPPFPFVQWVLIMLLGRGVNPHQASRPKNSRAVPDLPVWAFMACCTVKSTSSFTIIFRIRTRFRYVTPCSVALRGTRQFLSAEFMCSGLPV